MSGPEAQLRRIAWFMPALAAAGAAIWGLERSGRAALAFGAGSLASFLLWHFHVLIVKRMLTPGSPGRAGYALLSTGKLALIGLALAGIMERYPGEGIPFATGLLLSVGAILLEAAFPAFQKAEPTPPEPPEGPSPD
ncbi:MAG TPA: hypothetical protein VL181_02165 [Holophagaceae bacterium]|jgi:hypothetical protein|nr:hypothetical protein [Holophagaceae bacterium]